VDQLPEPYREAVWLRYREGLSPAGLAERLQISWEAQKKRLQRARALLLECLERKLALAEEAR
jgi:RNA polymerase sigma-70 factor (ECF subfamily)